jgi:hypothetical protein
MIARTVRFSIRRVASHEAMKAEEYRYWQSQPAHARMAAVASLSAEAYHLKDVADVQRLCRTLVRIER